MALFTVFVLVALVSIDLAKLSSGTDKEPDCKELKAKMDACNDEYCDDGSFYSDCMEENCYDSRKEYFEHCVIDIEGK